jgi:hypothetical protein
MRWLGCLGAGCWCLWSTACRRNQAGSGSFSWPGRCVRRSRLGRRGGSAAPIGGYATQVPRAGSPRPVTVEEVTAHCAVAMPGARRGGRPRRARSCPAAGRGAAGRPLASSRGNAGRRATRRSSASSSSAPASSTDPVPARTSRAASTLASASRTCPRRPRSRPVPAAPGTQRPAAPSDIDSACSASCSAAPGSGPSSASPASARRCSMAKSAGRIPAAAPPHQRHRRRRRRQPASRPRTRPAPAHRAHAPA